MNSTIDKRLRNIEVTLGIGTSSYPQCAHNVSDDDGNNSSMAMRAKGTDANVDVQGRVDNLCKSIDRHMTLSNIASNVQKSNALAHKLSPSGLLLTSSTCGDGRNSGKDGGGGGGGVNTNVNASVYVYRRQEILARCDELRYALEQLANIRDLLLISNPSLAKELQSKKGTHGDGDDTGADVNVDANANSRISMDHVASAPILASPSFTFAADPSNIQRLETLASEAVDVNDRSTALAQRVDATVNRYYSIVSAFNERLILMQELHEEKEAN